MNQRPIPAGPAEVTPEWLTTVFRQNSILTAGSVVGAKAEIFGQDRGFTGVIARMWLQYAGWNATDEAAPASVVVKFPTATGGTPSAYRTADRKSVV